MRGRRRTVVVVEVGHFASTNGFVRGASKRAGGRHLVGGARRGLIRIIYVRTQKSGIITKTKTEDKLRRECCMFIDTERKINNPWRKPWVGRARAMECTKLFGG